MLKPITAKIETSLEHKNSHRSLPCRIIVGSGHLTEPAEINFLLVMSKL